MANRKDNGVRCSFCGKPESQVRKIIAGPNGVYICDECIEICSEIVDDEFGPDEEDSQEADEFQINLKKPEELKIVVCHLGNLNHTIGSYIRIE